MRAVRARAPAGTAMIGALVVSVVAATFSAQGVTAAQAAGPSLSQRLTSIDRQVDAHLQELVRGVTAAGVPGAVARVQDGRTTRFASAGVADLATGDALRRRDRFRAGSVTKSFVATVVLQLVGERRMSLDETVDRRLPGLVAGGDLVTVRQLLNHTSGLANYTSDPEVLQGIAENRVFRPRELVAIAERHRGSAQPEPTWAYANTNYIVAGLLVEAVTGQRLGRIIRERIIEPLDLRHTSFPETSAAIPGRHARGYVPTFLVPTPDGLPFDVTELNPSAAWAAGALVSNVDDLARFYEALMGGELLPPRQLREMKDTVAQDPADPRQFRYGLGVERVQDSCGANWGHGGTVFGYQSMAYWNERTDRTVVLASTMFPVPAAAEAALTKLSEHALCGSG